MTDLEEKLLAQQNYRCFICDQPIDLKLDNVEIDHIIPRARGGKDDENNYAVTHEHCNRMKQDSDLRIARCLARYEDLKEKTAAEGINRPNLGDFLTLFNGGKYSLRAYLDNCTLFYATPESGTEKYSAEIYKDKLSGLEYAFMLLPLAYIHHDSRISIRAISPRIRGLLDEFLNGRPQLHITLAWGKLEDTSLKVYVFDGQHKAVAQMLLGVDKLPIRLFINPDLNLLLEANTNAGTLLKQVAFDQATQRSLGSQLYWEKIDVYRETTQRSADDLSFSEQDLVNFFKGERREVTKYILDDVRMGIIHHPDNRLKDFVDFSGRLGEKPLSYSTIEKTAFSLFIRKTPLVSPLNFRLEIGENPRQLEKDQMVRLFKILAEVIYIGKYDFDIGSNKVENKLRKGDNIAENHIRAVRMSREEVLYNLLRYVRDLIKQYFLMRGIVVEDEEIFQRKFPEELWELLGKLIHNLAELPLWLNKQLSSVFGGKQDHEYWKIIFETGKDRNGVQVLSKPLNLNDLVK